MKVNLVFNMSLDTTWMLLEELGNTSIKCLTPSSLLNCNNREFLSVDCIDIKREGFYNLDKDLINRMESYHFDEVYITIAGETVHNCGNVIELLTNLRYKRAFFYNCKGEKLLIPKENNLYDKLCFLYIKLVQIIYG